VPTPADALTPPDEVARVIDATWDVASKWVGKGTGSAQGQGLGASRGVFFSSFDPDVVVAMRAKLSEAKSECEMWYLSECGEKGHADARRTSVGAALKFASGLGLSGIVVPAAVLLRDEGIMAAAAAGGLLVQTYGLANNDPDGVERQRALGVVGVIVDDVIGLMGRVAGGRAGGASPPAPSTPQISMAAALGAAPAPAELVAAAVKFELRSITNN
jgi:glycerophosphoryl diester phosphodiesterase